MKFTPMILSIVFGCGAVSLARAQETPANVPVPGYFPLGSTSGVSVVPSPPADFDPLTASPAAREQYAIPPAPNLEGARCGLEYSQSLSLVERSVCSSYALWQKAVGGRANRVAPPATQLTPTTITNGPAQIVGPSAPYRGLDNFVASNIVKHTTKNWSGTALHNPTNPFQAEAVIGEFIVPTAHQAFGSCTGGWVHSSLWPGIDGWESGVPGDVLQAGVEVDAYCSGSTTQSFYSAWVEWYPFNEVRVSSPAIHPGDLVFVEVWNTSPTTGYAYFKNFSTNTTATYSLTAPEGTTLVGSSVEWIVERPGDSGSPTTLTNYIAAPWSRGIAWNYKASRPTYYYVGQNPASGTLFNITMLDDNGKPISSATIENDEFLWFLGYGSACGLATIPC